jgi:hypothetical protein
MVESFSSADLQGNPLGGREAALDELDIVTALDKVDIVTVYKRGTTVTVTIDPTTVTIVPRQTYVP